MFQSGFSIYRTFLNLTLGLFVTTQSVFSQVPLTDSLNRLVLSNIHDRTKIDLINDAIIQNLNNPEQTIKFCDIAIEKSRSLNDSFRLSKSINRKGVAYYYMGDYNNALDQFFKSLQISDKLSLKDNKVSDYNNVGLVLIDENLYRESLEYFFKSKEILTTTDRKDLLGRVLDNIGISYYSLNQFDSALVWFNESLAINKKLNQRKTLASNYKNIGNVYSHKGEYSIALSHYLEAKKIYEELNIKQEIATLLNRIALVNAHLGKFNDAEKSLKTAYPLISSIKSSTLHLEYLKALSKYYELKGSLKSSLSIHDKYIHLSDSLQQADKKRKFEQLKALVETNEKIKELQLLKTINTIQNEKIKSQKLIEVGIIILLVLSLAVLALIYNTLRIKDKINKKLEVLVTERTNELNKAKEKAEESDRNKSDLLVNISHEVRTPMNAIIGFSDLLMNKDIEENDREEYLKNLQRGTLSLLRLFDKIIFLAQIENNDFPVNKKNFNIEELFKNLQTKFNSRILEYNRPISIQYTISNNIHEPIIKSFPVIIEKVLDELLDNAIKFTPSGDVTFGIQIIDNSYKFFVKDTGEGIAPEHLSIVFDKFTKFTFSSSISKEGVGLGLAFIKKNLDLVNGTIEIFSKKDEGTLIEFTIPC